MFWVLIDPFWSNKTFRYHSTADRDYFPSLLVPVLRWVTLIVVMNQLNDTRGRREERSRARDNKMNEAEPGTISSSDGIWSWPWVSWSHPESPVANDVTRRSPLGHDEMWGQWPCVILPSSSDVSSAYHGYLSSLQVPGSRHHTEQEKLMTSDTGLWGRVIGLGSCHANRRYRVRGEAVSCGELGYGGGGCCGEADRWTQAWIIINGPIQLNVEHYLHIH